MSSLLVVMGAVLLVLLGLALGLQLLVRLRVRALRGRAAPAVPGRLGQQIASGRPALVYFHSPGCAACRLWTPRLEAMSRKHAGVHVVDVSRDWALARAFGVMATPSSVEIAGGRIIDYRVGPPPAGLLGRFA